MAGLLEYFAPRPGARIDFPDSAVKAHLKKRVGLLMSNPSAMFEEVFPSLEEARAHAGLLSPTISRDIFGQGQIDPALAKAYEDKMKNIALAALTVYHGSPHKFDKFDMSKIGTGEGAQAYGHGLYFAENPSVAKSYAKTLSEEKAAPLRSAIQDSEITRKQLAVLDNALSGKGIWPVRPDGTPASRQAIERNRQIYLDLLDSAEALKPKLASLNNLYKVDIPDEAIPRMLDWDKPLSEQPYVAKALKDYADLQGMKNYIPQGGIAPVLVGRGISGDTKGQDVYKFFGKDATSPDAAGNLKAFGISGIRYLDQASRGAGQGTSNYVLFDDMLPRILEINGIPTGNTPWGAGEWKGLLGK